RCLSLSELHGSLNRQAKDKEISPFVHRLTVYSNLGLERLWALVENKRFVPGNIATGTRAEIAAAYREEVKELLIRQGDEAHRLVRQFLREELAILLSRCAEELDQARDAERAAAAAETTLVSRFLHQTHPGSDLETFLCWRFVEEGLRLLVDRLFLERR